MARWLDTGYSRIAKEEGAQEKVTVQQEIRLNASEAGVWGEIRCKLAIERRDSFNADDLADWKLDKKLYGSEMHKQGAFFTKLLALNLVEKQNQVLGRWNRYIWNYKVKP